MGGGVFGFPSLPFGDCLEEQDGSRWDVGVGGCGAFPLVGAVLETVGGVDAGGFEELPNEFGPFCAVIVEGLIGPLAGDQDAASGDAQVFGLVGFALAASRRHGVAGAFGLDSVEQPHRTARRARRDAEFGVEPVGVVAVGVGGVLVEPGGLAYRFG